MVKYPEKMAERFAALGDPTRRSVIERLSRRGEMSVSEIAEPLRMSLPAVLKHVHILKENGLITCRKEGRTRYCALNPKAFEPMMNWLILQKRFWNASFDRLEKHLMSINNKKKK